MTSRFETTQQLLTTLASHPWAMLLLAGVALVLTYFLIKRIIIGCVAAIMAKQPIGAFQQLKSTHIFKSSTMLVSLLVVYTMIQYGLTSGHLPASLSLGIPLLLVGIVIALVIVINQLLSFVLEIITSRYPLNTALIRTIQQLIKVIIGIGAGVSILSILMNKSPVVILSSLGALTAILLLIFKDSILGFVASIQVTLLGIVKEGDWIEIPKYGADGNILDINISSLRVQNWDKTITTIPTYALVSEGVKNWKGMEETKARRIKRSLFINAQGIQFCTNTLMDSLKTNALFNPFMDHFLSTNTAPIASVTNMGLFRLYMHFYLSNHPNINTSLTLLVRQGQSSLQGVPLELYCFTNTTQWAAYETIQSLIFEHAFAAVGHFKLDVLQYAPLGKDA